MGIIQLIISTSIVQKAAKMADILLLRRIGLPFVKYRNQSLEHGDFEIIQFKKHTLWEQLKKGSSEVSPERWDR